MVWYTANIPRLRAVLRHDHKPQVPYCYYKLVTNVIGTIKIHVLSYPWYTTAVS
jgi:hypothetical protein